jgi:UDP-N-acetylglucosamine diphosphorylase/glucosamine-1-phosphate N-acetyltransferase
VKRPGLSPEDVWNRTDKWLSLIELPRTMPQARFIDYPWDLINWNEEALIVDSMMWRDNASVAPDGPYHLINGEDVLLRDGAKLMPGCVLDAAKGPIMIGKQATIGANAVVQGPCFIGDYSSITPTALIRPGTSIGPVCKVGGEVANSIIFGGSNKAHEGFLGDSYVGKWVNLGAGTTTSNLKNTYGEIDMQIGEKRIPTGRRFLGAIIGDHTKTAIGTRLTTGSYIGFNCMIATAGLVPKFVPSFTFLTDNGAERFEVDKAIEVAKQMFARRSRRWTDLEDKLMRDIAETARDVELS